MTNGYILITIYSFVSSFYL